MSPDPEALRAAVEWARSAPDDGARFVASLSRADIAALSAQGAEIAALREREARGAEELKRAEENHRAAFKLYCENRDALWLLSHPEGNADLLDAVAEEICCGSGAGGCSYVGSMDRETGEIPCSRSESDDPLGCRSDAAQQLRDLAKALRAKAALAAPAPVDETAGLPKDNDGKEQDAFEAWAKSEHYDMTEHPLHWLFMNERTSAARAGWRAGIRYCNRALASGGEMGEAG